MNSYYQEDAVIIVTIENGFSATVHLHERFPIKFFSVPRTKKVEVFIDKLVGTFHLIAKHYKDTMVLIDMTVEIRVVGESNIRDSNDIRKALRELEKEWEKKLPEPISTQ